MTRLPVPGSDDGNWGGILNGFLLVSHNADGTEKAGAPLILPVNLGPDLFTIDTNGGMKISPHDGSSLPLIVQSADDSAATLQVLNSSNSDIATITPRGLALHPSDSEGVGLYIQGSSIDQGDGLLMDLENGRSVVTVDPDGEVFIQPIGNGINLTLHADSGQTSNLQEWRDSSGTPQAWIDSDGNPGGTLTGGTSGEYLGVEANAFATSNSAGLLVTFDGTTATRGSSSLSWDNSSPDRIQILQAGVYAITGVVYWRDGGATGPLLVSIFTECGFNITDQRSALADSTNDSIQPISTTLYLQAGDDVILYVQQTTGSILTPDITLLVTRVS